MLTSTLNFKLLVFGEDPVSPDLYAQAEHVYLDSIGTTARTKTHEIAYWKDQYNSQFAKTGDRLFVYGFEFKGALIGFALVFYFKAHGLIVFDHIAIKEGARNLGAFFEFKNLITQDILQRNLEVNFVMAEIVTSKRGDPHPIDPKLLIQLLKQNEFKVAHLEYYTPSILEPEYGLKIETALLVRSNDRASQISAPLLFSLIETILDDLYIRWYTPHSKNIKAFRQQIERLRTLYREQLHSADVVELNGNWKEEHAPVMAALNSSGRQRRTPSPKPEQLSGSQFSGLSPTAILLALVLLTFTVLAGISHAYGLSTSNTLTIFIAALMASLAILGVWRREAASLATALMRLLSNLLRHHKDISR